ncbi:unnamed protein product, partial [Iphiclides podalirius]
MKGRQLRRLKWAHHTHSLAFIVGGYVRRRPRRCRCCESTNGIDTRPSPAPPEHPPSTAETLAAAETSSCEIGSRAPRHLASEATNLCRAPPLHTIPSNSSRN